MIKNVIANPRHCEERSNLYTYRKIASFLAMTQIRNDA